MIKNMHETLQTDLNATTIGRQTSFMSWYPSTTTLKRTYIFPVKSNTGLTMPWNPVISFKYLSVADTRANVCFTITLHTLTVSSLGNPKNSTLNSSMVDGINAAFCHQVVLSEMSKPGIHWELPRHAAHHLLRLSPSSSLKRMSRETFTKRQQRSCTHLANKDVCGFKMSAIHFGRLSRNGLDLNADLLAFFGAVNRFVVHLDARHHTNVYKLKRTIVWKDCYCCCNCQVFVYS